MPVADAFRATHASGTAPTTGIKIPTRRGLGIRLVIENTDGANDLDLSFDGGRSWFQIGQGTARLDLPVRFHYFFVRGNGGAANYQALIFEG